MTWPSAVVTYLVLWWLVLFAILPIGVQRNEQVETGHDAGAPVNPRLWRKALWTTLVSGVVWLIIFGIVESGVISFRDMADKP